MFLKTQPRPICRGRHAISLFERAGENSLPLEEKEERQLVQEALNGNAEARRKLVEQHLTLVQTVVSQYGECGEDPDDLVSLGCLGLMRAVDKVSPDYPNRFGTYASWFIHSAISDHLDRRTLIHLPREVVRRARHYLKTRERLRREEKPHDPESVAEQMELPRQEGVALERAARLLSGRARIDPTAGPNQDEQDQEPLDRLGGREDQGLEAVDRRDTLETGLKRLPQRTAYIFSALLGWKTPRKTTRELADEMNLTTERIRQLRDEAIALLKA